MRQSAVRADRQDAGPESAEALDLVYQAEPTLQRLHASPARVRGVMGPLGSGKSSGCVKELWRLARQQQPMFKGGPRKTVSVVIRNTYPELVSTTVETFKEWFPPPLSTITYGAPIKARVMIGDVDWVLYFLSIDRPDDVKKLLSLNATNAWLNEVREIPKEALDMVLGRIGRYPKMPIGPTDPRVIMDTNPPDVDHWYYKLAEQEQPKGWQFFRQPGALIRIGRSNAYAHHPRAENIRNLKEGYGYYYGMLGGKSQDWINVYILGEYGTVLEGRPCYPAYIDSRHASSTPLEAYGGLPLRLGFDYGRTPACIIGQYLPNGQLRILRELCVDTEGPGMSIRSFARDHVKPYLATHFPNMTVISRGDPAGSAAGQGDERSCQDILAEEGIPTEPASSNAIEKRLDDVEWFMKATVDNGQPAYLLDGVNCPILRRGKNGGYHMQRIQVSGEAMYRSVPVKNKYSHPSDGEQYLADGCRNVKVESRASARTVVQSKRAWGA